MFEVTADYVNISGFTVEGATGYWPSAAVIYLYHADYCNISNINCSNNGAGISCRFSNNNLICLNNFINNVDNVYSSESTNAWNSTEEITYTYNGSTYTNYLGNYWDDYEENYPDAEEIDDIGMWDTPYSIDEDKDYYPLMERFENYLLNIS